jgi:hypothetical protein
MERLKRFTRELVVVSAATCWVLVVTQPVLASTLMATADPTLTADPMSAYPGDQITIHGVNFLQCAKYGDATNLMVYWDGSDLTKGTGLYGEFSVDAAVPSDASVGLHQVTAVCYDPRTGTVTSDALASAGVQVLPRPSPGLQLSSSEAAAGGGVTVAGTGFGQCAGKGFGDSVQLLWDTSTLGGPVGLDGKGAFSADVTVPAAATAGSGHTVAAECYDPVTGSATSGVLARALFSVTSPTSPASPASTPPTSPTSPASTPQTSPTTSPASTPPTSPTTSPTSATSSPTVVAGQPPAPSGGRWPPVALTAGAGGGLAVVVVLLAGLLAMHARARPRNSSWVHQHLRAVAQPLDAAPSNARIHSRPGAAALSIGLDPHPDRLGNQRVKEITP